MHRPVSRSAVYFPDSLESDSALCRVNRLVAGCA